jgi:hypothetical protein
MLTKLTLNLNKKTITKGKKYAKDHNTSLSKLVEYYFESFFDKTKSKNKSIPPITKELSGMAKLKTPKKDKALLIEALNKKYL